MSKILYIKANLRDDNTSRSLIVANSFLEEYKKKNPKDEIITLDLYKENVDFLRMDSLISIGSRKTEDSKKDPLLKYAYQFTEADKYIIAAPMWNLGIPAILKAYIDNICVGGITYKYTEQGQVGLLENKKAIFFNSRGGIYANSPVENCEKYMKDIMTFLGINDFKSVSIDGVDIIGSDIDKIVNDAKVKANNLLENF